jgi:hypothetical protein
MRSYLWIGVLVGSTMGGLIPGLWGDTPTDTMLLSTAAAAENIDKAKLFEITKRDCPVQILDNKPVVDALHVRGGNLDSFCECAARRFVSQIEDADSGNPVSTSLKWNGAQAFCLGASKRQ